VDTFSGEKDFENTMIDYDPHDWWGHFWDIKGSLVKEIFGRVTTCVVWSAAVVAIDTWVMDVGIAPLAHQIAGLALGLLLVFRTNASYDRFWEGRKMWGSIINESRNLARGAAVHLRTAPQLQASVAKWTTVFVYAVMHRLRREQTVGEGAKLLTPAEVAEFQAAEHLPMLAARRLSETLRAARDDGLISDYILTTLDQNTQLLVDYLGACERIQRTPLPFAYMVHLRRTLIWYCFTLPFALVQEYQWATVFDIFLVAYIMFGIEEIGVIIEDPFGYDDNDLPLEKFCEMIDQNVHEIVGLE
jgi:putative membrane protein